MKSWPVFAAVALAGCSFHSELERPALDVGLTWGREAAREESPAFRGPGVGIEKPAGEARVTEEDIRLALEAAGPLDGPVRIAVVELRPGGPGYRPVSVAPEQLEAFRAALGAAAESVQPVPQMFLPQTADLPSLRYAAARVGCNALFVFGRAESTGTYYNSWAHLNWLVLPIFAVPGKTVEIYAAAEGALVDIATSRVRAVAAADVRLDDDVASSASTARPKTELSRAAATETLAALGTNLGRELATLRVGKK